MGVYYVGSVFLENLTRVKSMNIAQIKAARLGAQAEREVLVNEMMKASIVRWEDLIAVLGERISMLRNHVQTFPFTTPDPSLSPREQTEVLRKDINKLLTEWSMVGTEDFEKILLKNKRLIKYTKASTAIDPDEREQNNGNSLKSLKSQNKPR